MLLLLLKFQHVWLCWQEAKKFAGKLDSGHDDTCPWRNNACDQGLAVFPATLPDTVCREFQQQAAALAGVSALPPLSSSTLHSVCQHRRYANLLHLFENNCSLIKGCYLPNEVLCNLNTGSDAASSSRPHLWQSRLTVCSYSAGHANQQYDIFFFSSVSAMLISCMPGRSRLASLLQNGAQQGPVTPALEQPQSANAQQAELPPIDLHLLCSGLAGVPLCSNVKTPITLIKLKTTSMAQRGRSHGAVCMAT